MAMQLPKLCLILAFILGTVFRLWFPTEIEYKWDEYFMYMMSQLKDPTNGADLSTFPLLGMPSGVSLKNPGLSVWIFIGLAKVFNITTPMGLSQLVSILSIVSCFLLVLLANRYISNEKRPIWYWAIALVLVNPIAIIYHRKIWAQCILPIFCVAHIYFWIHRDRKWGSLLWGLTAAILGQIHMSGFFFATGFFIWTLYTDKNSRKNLPYFITGGLLGILPMIPWLEYLITRGSSENGAHFNFYEPFRLKFLGYFMGDPLGIHLATSLGRDHFLRYLSGPQIGDTRIYLNFVLHFMLLIWVLSLVKSFLKNIPETFLSLKEGIQSKQTEHLLSIGALVGYGSILFISTLGIFRHYLIITFPLQWIFLVLLVFRLKKDPDRSLFTLFNIQILMSLSFFGYIHVHKGADGGDYGVAYKYQSENPSKEFKLTQEVVKNAK